MEPVKHADGADDEAVLSGQQLALQALLLACAIVGFALTTRYFQKQRSATAISHEDIAEHDSASTGSHASKSKGLAAKSKSGNKAKSKTKAGKGAATTSRDIVQEPVADSAPVTSTVVEEVAAPVAAATHAASAASPPEVVETSRDQAPTAPLLEAVPEVTQPPASTVSSAEPETSAASSAAVPAQAPLLHCAGGDFNGSNFVDLAASGSFMDTFGGAISISFTARWDALNSWSRIVDFGNGSPKDNIVIANFEQRNTLVADVYRGAARKRLLVQDIITIGEMHEYLLTVSAMGYMRMYQDGTVVGELSKGYAPKDVDRSHLYVGKSSNSADGMFQGRIVDVKLWSDVVDWNVAFAEQGTVLLPQVTTDAPVAEDDAASPSTAEKAVADDEVSDRVAKMMAKKAERKARKARERQEQDDAGDKDGEAALDASATAANAEAEEAPAPKPAASRSKAAAKEAAQKKAEAAKEAAAKEAAAKEAAEKEAAAQKAAEQEAAKREAAAREAAEQERAQREAAAAQEAASRRAAEKEAAEREAERAAAVEASASKQDGTERKKANKKPKDTSRELVHPQREEVPIPSLANTEAEPEVDAGEVGETAASGSAEAASKTPIALVDEDGFEVAAPSRQRRALKAQQRATEAEQRKQQAPSQPIQQGPSSQAPSQPSQAPSQASRSAVDATHGQRLPVDQLFAEAARAQAVRATPSRMEAPAAASASTAADGATTSTAPPRTALEREILKYEKKIREVDRLRSRHESGEVLEPNQIEKLEKGDSLRQRLAELQQQHVVEKSEEESKMAQAEVPIEHEAEQPAETANADAGQRTSLRQWAKTASRNSTPFVAGGKGGKKGDGQDAWMEPLDGMPYAQVCNPGPICIGGKGVGQFVEIGQKEFEEGMPPMPFGHMVPIRGPEPEPEFDPSGHPPAMFLRRDMQAMPVPMDNQERWESCWEWVRTGWCPRGITCRWEHPALGPVAFGGSMPFWSADEEGQLPPGAMMMGPAGHFVSPDDDNLSPPAGMHIPQGGLPPGAIPMGVLPPGGLPPGPIPEGMMPFGNGDSERLYMPIPDGVMTFNEDLQNRPLQDILGEDVEASGIVTPQ